MKFSISFKYSNVTFKNKETKETIAYDTKASEGNTFTFDNVDEDVVIGMLKGIKDRKASQLFAYDDLRTNFINVMARNKCKELYDKLDKAEWKIEDIAISNITIKDIEFTKPTMNAREAITVESKKVVKESANNFKPGDLVDWFVPEDDDRYGEDFGGEVFHGGEVYKRQGDVYEVNFGEEGMFYPCAKDLEPYDSTYPRTGHDEEFSESGKPRLNGVVCINWEWSSEYGDTDSGEDQIPVPDTSEETIKRAVRKFCNKKSEWDEVGGHSDNVYLEVFLTDYGMGEPEFLFDGSFAYGDIKWFDNNGKTNHKYTGETYIESKKNEKT